MSTPTPDMTLLFELTRPDAHLTLELVPDAEHQKRAMAHGAGYALSHLGSDIAPTLRPSVRAIAYGLTQLDLPADANNVNGRIADHLARQVSGDTSVRFVRALATGQSIPRWPGRLRTGDASDASGLWPFDPDLAGFRTGRRRLIKREAIEAASVDAELRWLREKGLVARVVTVAGRPPVVFAAADEATIDEAALHEAELGAPAPARDEAAIWMGHALGYPKCCIEAFSRCARRDDVSLAALLLPPLGSVPAPPESAWLIGSLGLISYAPCSLTCSATLELAGEIRDVLEAERPGFGRIWSSIARRVLAVTHDGEAFALDIDGPLDGGVIRSAIELVVPRNGSDDIVRDHPELAGTTVRVDGGILTFGQFRAGLAADHRG